VKAEAGGRYAETISLFCGLSCGPALDEGDLNSTADGALKISATQRKAMRFTAGVQISPDIQLQTQ